MAFLPRWEIYLEAELEKLALLARLEFAPQDLSDLGRDLQEIIAYMQELVQAQVQVPPTPEVAAQLRPDACHQGSVEAVELASDTHEGWIRLPRVVP